MSSSVDHSDIDSLVLAARDRGSRRLIGEAISACRSGMLRSAIMSTWIAVAYDITARARELAGLGEAAPRAFVADLDAAIATKDKRKLQTIESELLDKANSDLQLLAPHEYSALSRPRDDRHLFAHPAFVLEDELFQPSPELVRAHIVHALQHLLAPLFTAGDSQAVLTAAADNGQIWDAAGTPEVLDQLFDNTLTLLPASRPHWDAFLCELRGRQQQRYSGVRERLDANT